MQIERDEFLRTFQAFTNRYPSPYQASYSNNPLYYSQNIGRESPNNPVRIYLVHVNPSTHDGKITQKATPSIVPGHEQDLPSSVDRNA